MSDIPEGAKLVDEGRVVISPVKMTSDTGWYLYAILEEGVSTVRDSWCGWPVWIYVQARMFVYSKQRQSHIQMPKAYPDGEQWRIHANGRDKPVWVKMEDLSENDRH